MMFFFLMPIIIIVLPILAALGIPIRAVLILIGIFSLFAIIFVKWMCDGAKSTYLWCLIPAAIAILCFLGARSISYDFNLIGIIENIFK